MGFCVKSADAGSRMQRCCLSHAKSAQWKTHEVTWAWRFRENGPEAPAGCDRWNLVRGQRLRFCLGTCYLPRPSRRRNARRRLPAGGEREESHSSPNPVLFLSEFIDSGKPLAKRAVEPFFVILLRLPNIQLQDNGTNHSDCKNDIPH